MKKILIIGFGSIGKRHANVFLNLNCSVAIVSKQISTEFKIYSDLQSALIDFLPDSILICTETSKHVSSLELLKSLKFKGPIFVEKPITDVYVSTLSAENVYVLYNLRFSDLIIKLKSELQGKKVLSANIHCAQYLPTWRPDRDYKSTYSAKRSEGGGVARDLSHELDYATLLFGKFKSIFCVSGKFSNLEIDTEDFFSLLGTGVRTNTISISLNYIDKITNRNIVVNTDEFTYRVDFIKGELLKDSTVLISNAKTIDTYSAQAQAIIQNNLESFCTFSEAMEVVKLIELAEKSSLEEKVIIL